jgi:hypothetical protein
MRLPCHTAMRCPEMEPDSMAEHATSSPGDQRRLATWQPYWQKGKIMGMLQRSAQLQELASEEEPHAHFFFLHKEMSHLISRRWQLRL